LIPTSTLSLHDALPIFRWPSRHLYPDRKRQDRHRGFCPAVIKKEPYKSSLTCMTLFLSGQTGTSAIRPEALHISALICTGRCRRDRKSTRLNSSHVSIS